MTMNITISFLSRDPREFSPARPLSLALSKYFAFSVEDDKIDFEAFRVNP